MRLLPSFLSLLALASCAATATSAASIERRLPSEDLAAGETLTDVRRTLTIIRHSILATLTARGGLPPTTQEEEYKKSVVPLLLATKDAKLAGEVPNPVWQSASPYTAYKRTKEEALKWGEDGSNGTVGYGQGSPTGQSMIHHYYTSLLPIFTEALNGSTIVGKVPAFTSLSTLYGASYLSSATSGIHTARGASIAKVLANKEAFCPLIANRDAVGLRKTLTDFPHEEAAIAAGDEVIRTLVPDAPQKLIDAVRALYVDYFIPVGKDVEVAEMLRRGPDGKSPYCS